MKTLLILVVLSVFFLGTTAIWLYLDHSPPPWDDGFYLTNSLKLYDALFDGGVTGYARTFLAGMDSKPPLISVLPTAVYLIVGRHPRAAYAINLGFLLVTFVAVYRIAKRSASPRAGLLAVYIAGTMPMIYGLSRWFLVECGLIALVCVVMCLIGEFRARGAWTLFLLGMTCGFGLLMKVSFPVYVAIPLLYFAARKALRLVTILAFGVPLLLIALPWYAFNFRHALGIALKAGSAGTATIYATGDVFSPTAIGAYLINLLNTGPALYFIALPVLLAIGWRSLGPGAKKGLLLCALWGSPVIFLIFGHYRDPRYAAPLLPALAVALAIVSDSMLRNRVAIGVACVLLALPLLSMLQGSFHLLGDRPFELGGLLLNAPRFYYARAYDRSTWPNEEILSDVSRLGRFSVGETRTLIVGTDTLHLNADNLRLVAVKKRLPLEVSTSAYDQDLKLLLQRVDAAAYFVYEEGGEEPSPFNSLGKSAVREVRESGKFTELPIGRSMPDGGTAHVFENVSLNGVLENGAFIAAGLDSAPSCDVTFADRVRLTGFSFERTADGLRVKYRWQCLRPLDREYWCFSHLLDDRDNIVRNLDHKILNGKPPMTVWKPGDVAIESLFIPAQEIPMGKTYRLATGLYHPASGERLRILHSNLPLGENQTAIITREKR